MTEEEAWEAEERRGDHDPPPPFIRSAALGCMIGAIVIALFVIMFQNGFFMHGD